MFVRYVLPLLASAAAAAPSVSEVTDADTRDCVEGEPTRYGEWVIEYDNVELDDDDSGRGYILKPGWVSSHETVTSALHLSMGKEMFPYGEFKCQFSCNSDEACVSYVGYQTQDSDDSQGDLYCHFFDALIDKDNVVARGGNGTFSITHAYNRLCGEGNETRNLRQ